MSIGSNLRAISQLASAVGQNVSDRASQVAEDLGGGVHQTNPHNAWSEGDPLSFRQLSYPSDITNNMENGHYMLFYVNVQNKTKYKYKDPKGVSVGNQYEITETSYEQTNTGSLDAATGKTAANKKPKVNKITYKQVLGNPEGEDAGEASYLRGRVSGGGKGNIIKSDSITLTPNVATGFSAQYPTTTRITDSIALYLPANVSDATTAGYDGAETGILGLVAAGGGAFMDAMKNQDYAAAAGELVGGVQAISQEAFKRAGGMLVGAATETDEVAVRALGAKMFGQAENPYIEMLFKQVGLRSFSYTFQFSPRNQKESEEVQAIIRMFRFHMLPELKGSNHRYLTLPSTFDIHYMYQYSREKSAENSFYSKIATCVLTGVDVDYTPGGVKSFADGSPTQITMALSFQETELLTKEKVDKGY